MKAAVVREAGETPVYGDFREPAPAGPGEVRIAVTAAPFGSMAECAVVPAADTDTEDGEP
jgi:hypothetical protein